MNPILVLENDIRAAVFNITKRRAGLLNQLTRDYSFEIVDEDKLIFNASPDKKVIKASTGGLETLWLCAYAAYLNALDYEHASTGDTSLRVSAANALNAYFEHMGTISASWPAAIPTPDQSIQEIKATNEIFLCAIACILLHEVAHVYLSHTPAIKSEIEADGWAMSWIFNGITDLLELKKKGLGVATAMIMIVGLCWGRTSSTHPPSTQRFRENLKSLPKDAEDFVYAYCATALQRHFEQRGIPFPVKDSNITLKDAALQCLQAIENPIGANP